MQVIINSEPIERNATAKNIMPPIARRRSNRRSLSRRLGDSHSSVDEGNITKNKSNDGTNETCTDMVMMQSPSASRQQQQQRRRSSRGNSSLTELAKEIVTNRKRVVFITGAGISVASGVRPFRDKSNHCNEAIWTQRIWTTATREIFRKDPLEWYNEFWIPFMTLPVSVKPNAAHQAMNWLLEQSTTTATSSDADNDADNDNDDPGRQGLRIKMITQNVDGLIPPNPIHSIEAHGRVGLYKCIPDEDSDTDSESDDDDDRLVHLGHRRKWRRRRQLQDMGEGNNSNIDSTSTSTSNDHEQQQQRRQSSSNATRLCPFQHEKSLPVTQVEPSSIQRDLRDGKGPLSEPPKCPHCANILAPQALLFDEGYHSHDFYRFQKMEEWLGKCSLLTIVVWKVLIASYLHTYSDFSSFSHSMLLRILFSLPNSRS